MDKCPKCNSTEISGLYPAFWAVLNEDGEDSAINFGDHQSSTELGSERLCRNCDHEFESEY